jgi:hypothetical protein
MSTYALTLFKYPTKVDGKEEIVGMWEILAALLLTSFPVFSLVIFPN